MSKNEDVLTIICSAQQGNEKAWSNLVSRYSKVVWSATYDYGFPDTNREDIVQDVFIKLIKSIKSYDPTKANFSTFITTITKRTCIDKLRKDKAKPDVVPLPPGELAMFPSPSQEDPTYSQEMIDSLNDILEEKLTTEQRRVIELFYFKRCSYKQIAEIMNRDDQWVKNTLHRTREYLRQILTKSKRR